MQDSKSVCFLKVVIYWIHCTGCLFYYMVEIHDGHTWLEIAMKVHKSREKYIAAVYWAITTISTVGYGDLHSVNEGERLFCIMVMILYYGPSLSHWQSE